MQNLIGTKVIHAVQSVYVDMDTTLIPTVCGNWASQAISSPWTDSQVDCKGCIRGINAVHRKALILNGLVNEGVAKGEQMLAQYGEHNFNSVSTDSELVGMLELQREWLAADLALAFENMDVATTRKSIVARATLVVLYTAELAFRTGLHEVDKVRAQEAKANHTRVHDVVEAERIAHIMNPRNVVFEVGLDQNLQMRFREVPADPMVTENNYGEQGPFHFTEHPHDQVRAQRYDSIINTLTEMVANANLPVPTTEELIQAIIGLEQGEAIEEDRARFPYPSFTRFALPVPCGYRHKDGMIERGVYIIGSDVSRRIYKQNVVLIARPQGPAQVVAEGDLVS